MKLDIDYASFLDKAMHFMVKEILTDVAKHGLPGNHHFFISFLTHYKGVVLPSRLLRQYPESMSIILQYQFQELRVMEDKFSVLLDFNGIFERIEIPFFAIETFADPSVAFSLQFNTHQNILHEMHIHETPKDINSEKAYEITDSKDLPKKTDNVISFIDFKKKK